MPSPILISVLLFVCLGVSTADAAPVKHLFVMGGGGESPAADNQFEYGLRILGEKSRAAGWNPTVLYDGDHPKSFAKVFESFGAAQEERRKFDSFTFETQLAEIRRGLKEGKFAKGDQVFFVVDSHGLKGELYEASHSVFCGERGRCSLDPLNELIQLLENAGVKVAIADTSCYSGASLKLGSERTCRISSATAETLGYSGFANQFFRELDRGKNLEEVFLAARRRSSGFSSITTAAGRSAQEAIEPIIEQVTFEPLWELIFSKECSAQNTNESFREFLATLTRITSYRGFGPELEELRQEVRQYREALAEARALLARAKQLEQKVLEAKDGQKMPLSFAAFPRLDEFEKAYAEMPFIESFRKGVLLARSATASREHFEEDPDFNEYVSLIKKMDRWGTRIDKPFSNFLSPVNPIIERIDRLEKQVYDDLYRALDTGAPNPCRDFRF